jgi:hypothetical protein
MTDTYATVLLRRRERSARQWLADAARYAVVIEPQVAALICAAMAVPRDVNWWSILYSLLLWYETDLLGLA